MLKFTALTVLISIVHLALGTWDKEMPHDVCNEKCDKNPFGDKLICNYSLAEQVYQSPAFEIMVEASPDSKLFSSGCDTFIAIDDNTTFLLLRYVVLTNGSEILQIFLQREIKRCVYELVGFTDREGPGSVVFYSYVIAQSCVCQPGAIAAVYRSYCFAKNVETDIPKYATFSYLPRPPYNCMKEITENVKKATREAWLPEPIFDNAKYTRNYKCVSKYNGKDVINAASIPPSNAVEL